MGSSNKAQGAATSGYNNLISAEQGIVNQAQQMQQARENIDRANIMAESVMPYDLAFGGQTFNASQAGPTGAVTGTMPTTLSRPGVPGATPGAAPNPGPPPKMQPMGSTVT